MSSTVYGEAIIRSFSKRQKEELSVVMMVRVSIVGTRRFWNLWGAHCKNLKNMGSQARRDLGAKLEICYVTLKNNDLHRRNF